MAKTKKPNAFEVALAARQGTIPAESIRGSARLLYRDKTISDEQLTQYAQRQEPLRKEFSHNQPRTTAKFS